MRKTIAAALVASILAGSVAAAPPQRKAAAKRPAPPRAEPAACAALHNDYETASKKLARNWAEGTTDRSAARATMRSADDGVIMEQARMTMDLLRTNGCKAPTSAPTKGPYEMQAMACQSAMLRAQHAMILGRRGMEPVPECDIIQWRPQAQ